MRSPLNLIEPSSCHTGATARCVALGFLLLLFFASVLHDDSMEFFVRHVVSQFIVASEPQPIVPSEPLWFKPFACYGLATLYAALFILSVVLFIVIHLCDPRFTIQKTFYLLIGLMSAST